MWMLRFWSAQVVLLSVTLFRPAEILIQEPRIWNWPQSPPKGVHISTVITIPNVLLRGTWIPGHHNGEEHCDTGNTTCRGVSGLKNQAKRWDKCILWSWARSSVLLSLLGACQVGLCCHSPEISFHPVSPWLCETASESYFLVMHSRFQKTTTWAETWSGHFSLAHV